MDAVIIDARGTSQSISNAKQPMLTSAAMTMTLGEATERCHFTVPGECDRRGLETEEGRKERSGPRRHSGAKKTDKVR